MLWISKFLELYHACQPPHSSSNFQNKDYEWMLYNYIKTYQASKANSPEQMWKATIPIKHLLFRRACQAKPEFWLHNEIKTLSDWWQLSVWHGATWCQEEELGNSRLSKESGSTVKKNWKGNQPTAEKTNKSNQSKWEQSSWLGGSVGWCIVPHTKRLSVQFPVTAHT